MPKLKNHRRELFAQAIFNGLTQVAAYKKAGYRGPAKKWATQIANCPEVQARIAELNAQVERKIILTKTQALEMLTRGAMAAFHFIERAGQFGRRTIQMDPEKIAADPDLKLAVREVTMAKDGTSTVKLHDYKEALALIAKLEGWEAPKALDVKFPGTIRDMTDAQLRALAGGEGTAPNDDGK